MYDEVRPDHLPDPGTSGIGQRPIITTSTSRDPFDRPLVRTIAQGRKTSKARFNYLRLTEQVAAEEQIDAAHGWYVTKAFTYSPAGNPLPLTSTPLTEKRISSWS